METVAGGGVLRVREYICVCVGGTSHPAEMEEVMVCYA